MDTLYRNLEFLMEEYRLTLNFYRKFEHNDCHRIGRDQKIRKNYTEADEAKISKK